MKHLLLLIILSTNSSVIAQSLSAEEKIDYQAEELCSIQHPQEKWINRRMRFEKARGVLKNGTNMNWELAKVITDLILISAYKKCPNRFVDNPRNWIEK